MHTGQIFALNVLTHPKSSSSTLVQTQTFVYEQKAYYEFGPFGVSGLTTVTVTFETVGNAEKCIGVNPTISYWGEYHTVDIVDKTCTLVFDAQYGKWPSTDGFIQVRHENSTPTSTVLDVHKDGT